jgi:ATP-dependent Clp protease ATP-binding subunit ClpA
MRSEPHVHRRNRNPSDPDDVDEHRVLDAVHNHFPREVLGRIDDIIVFGPLSLEAVRGVWRRELLALGERLTARGQAWRVVIEPEAEEVFQREMSASAHFEGARAVVRFFDRAVIDRCLELVGRSGRVRGTIRVGMASRGTIRYWISEEVEPTPTAALSSPSTTGESEAIPPTD